MQPYLESVSSQALRIRWISVQCYEMVLPGGKVLVTDPFYFDASAFDGIPEEELTKNQKLEKQVYAQRGFSVDEFTGADYILLNHIHGDHSNLVGQLWHRFYGRVLVPAYCAEEVAKTFDIPYAAIYPLYPGNTYYFARSTPAPTTTAPSARASSSAPAIPAAFTTGLRALASRAPAASGLSAPCSISTTSSRRTTISKSTFRPGVTMTSMCSMSARRSPTSCSATASALTVPSSLPA